MEKKLKEEKRRNELLLEDWSILSKRYMKLQKKYNDLPKRDQNIDKLFSILKKQEKDIKLLIDCINHIGNRIREMRKRKLEDSEGDL